MAYNSLGGWKKGAIRGNADTSPKVINKSGSLNDSSGLCDSSVFSIESDILVSLLIDYGIKDISDVQIKSREFVKKFYLKCFASKKFSEKVRMKIVNMWNKIETQNLFQECVQKLKNQSADQITSEDIKEDNSTDSNFSEKLWLEESPEKSESILNSSETIDKKSVVKMENQEEQRFYSLKMEKTTAELCETIDQEFVPTVETNEEQPLYSFDTEEIIVKQSESFDENIGPLTADQIMKTVEMVENKYFKIIDSNTSNAFKRVDAYKHVDLVNLSLKKLTDNEYVFNGGTLTDVKGTLKFRKWVIASELHDIHEEYLIRDWPILVPFGIMLLRSTCKDIDDLNLLIRKMSLCFQMNCIFSFDKCRFNSNGSITGYGGCRYKSCAKIIRLVGTKDHEKIGRYFILYINNPDPTDHSAEEPLFQQIRGKNRTSLKDGFVNPEKLFQKQQEGLDMNAAVKGNTGQMISKHVAFKIGSEIARSNLTNIHCELVKLVYWSQTNEKFLEVSSENNSLRLSMISPKIYKLLQSNAEPYSLSLHLDATGQLVKPIECCEWHTFSKRILIHEGLTEIKNHALPVCQMVTTKQDAETLANGLTSIVEKIMRAVEFMPFGRVIIDWSHAYIIAIAHSFCKMSVDNYLNFMYRQATTKVEEEKPQSFVYIIICYSHFMRLISEFCNRHLKGDKKSSIFMQQKQCILGFFALIKSLKTIESVKRTFHHMVVIFCSEFITKEIKEAISALETYAKDKNLGDELKLDDDQAFEENTNDTQYSKSKWYTLFKHIFEKESKTLEKHNDEYDENVVKNPYFNPEIMEKLIQKYFAYLPLWCECGHGELEKGDVALTNGAIESRFRFLKHTLFNKLRNNATYYVAEIQKNYEQIIMEIEYAKLYRSKEKRKRKRSSFVNLTDGNACKKLKMSQDNSQLDVFSTEETWQKKGSSNGNIPRPRYTKPTFNAIQSIDLTECEEEPKYDLENTLKFDKKFYVDIARNSTLELYELTSIIKQNNYYDDKCLTFARLSDESVLWLAYSDYESLKINNSCLSNFALDFALRLFIKNEFYSADFKVIDSANVSKIFTHELTLAEQNAYMNRFNFFDEAEKSYVCPIYVPALNNVGIGHWVLAIIDFTEHNFYFFDSMLGKGNTYFKNFKKFLLSMNKFSKTEMNAWKLLTQDTCAQSDAVNCGAYLLGFARAFITQNDRLKSVIPHYEREYFSSMICQKSDKLHDFCVICSLQLDGSILTCVTCTRSKHSYCVNDHECVDDIYVCHRCTNYFEKCYTK